MSGVARCGVAGRGPALALVLLAAAAVAAGASLRLAGMNRKGLWIDEVMIASRSTQEGLGAVIEGSERSPSPPLYFAALWCWTRLWGNSDAAVRSLSAAIGVLTLPATYLVWAGLIGRRAALWSVALLGLNAFHIGYSQDAKMYAAVWLLATVSCGAYLRVALGGGRRWLPVYGLSTAALPMVSYVGLAAVGVQAAHAAVIWHWRPGRRGAIREAGIVAGLSLFPLALWSWHMYEAAAGQRGHLGWIPDAPTRRPLSEAANVMSVFLLGYRTSMQAPGGAWARGLSVAQVPLVAGSLALLASATWRALRGVPAPGADAGVPAGPEVWLFLAAWWLLPVAEAYAFSVAVYSLWGVPRYLTAVAPGLILWVGAAVAASPRGRLALGVGGGLLLANAAMVAYDWAHLTRTPWRHIAAIISAAADTPSVHRLKQEPGRDAGLLRKARGFKVSTSGWANGAGLPVPLRHALREAVSNPEEIETWEEQFARDEEAARYILVKRKTRHSQDVPGRAADAFGNAYESRKVYTAPIFEDPYSSTPTLHKTHQVEVWISTLRPSEYQLKTSEGQEGDVQNRR